MQMLYIYSHNKQKKSVWYEFDNIFEFFLNINERPLQIFHIQIHFTLSLFAKIWFKSNIYVDSSHVK
jgi:hypothetical protein